MVDAYNPHECPVRLSLLTMSGKTVADIILEPGTHELRLSSLAHTVYLYRIRGRNIRLIKGKITFM
jgi:hypothetical protein